MVLLGLILIALGAIAIVAAVFTASGSVELLGTDIGALAIYLVGLGSGLAVLFGYSLAKLGTKRSLRHRREQKKLGELSEKLDRVEHERRGDLDDEDRDRPGP